MSWTDNFSTLFELLPIGAYRTDASGRQFRANPAMVRIFGFETEAEMLASSKAAAEGWYALPGRRAEFRRQLDEHGSVRDFVSEMRRHGTGETFWISENAHLVRDAAGHVLYHEGTVEDITERVRAQQMLQLTLDHAGRGIASVAPDGTVVLYNRALLRLLNLPEALLAPRPKLRDIIRFQEERGDFGEDFELLGDGARGEFREGRADLPGTRTYLRRTTDGRVIEVSSQTSPDGSMVRTFSDVTGYVKTQADLAARTHALQITLDSMSQGILAMDSEDRVILWNRRFRELLGFPESFLAKKPTLQQMLEVQIERGDFGPGFQRVDPAARDYVRQNVPPVRGPVSYLRKTADGRTLEVRTQPLPDGGVVRTYTDMTQYAAAQEALAQSQAQLKALVDNIPDRVWLKDVEGRFLLVNRSYQQRFGLGEAELVGRTGHEVFGREIGDHHRETDLQAMAMDRPLHYEDVIADPPPGTFHHVEIAKVALRDEHGRCIGMVGIARDITLRKQAVAALIAGKEAAEASERGKAQFIANMGQAIRPPIDELAGMCERLLATALTPQQRDMAETMRASSHSLLRLIGDVLDASKAQSDASKPSPRRVGPLASADAEVRREIAQLFAEEAPRLLVQVVRGLARRDAPAILIASHSLAGSASYFEADALVQLSRRIERAAGSGDFAGIEALVAPLEAAVESTLRQLREAGG